MAVALITGGSSGIGQAAAMLFAQRGYQVAIAARRTQPLEAVRQAIADAGGKVMSVTANVAVSAEVNQMVDAVIAAWGQIDTLIHAAGIAHEGTILNTTEAQWDETLNINLKGTYLVNQSVLKHMIDRGQGSIVNVASDAGLTGGRNLAAYCASKGGVVLLTKAMALDHARQGVRVNALCPGPVDTPMTAGMSATEMAHWQAMLPIQRFASAAEVAEAAYFLAHAEYATGSCLSIDGGNTAGGSI